MVFSDSYFEDEVRDGFYVSSMMKRAWAAQLEVLHVIQDICEKHGIWYFAEWGTLLGAVRHGGFIPWDDDMDICMERNEYRRFLQAAEEEMPEGYWILDYRTMGDDDYMIGRVLNSRPLLLPDKERERFHGFPYSAGIDIFQLDYVPADPKRRERFRDIFRGIIDMLGCFTWYKDHPDPAGEKELDRYIGKVERAFDISFDQNKPMRQQMVALLENEFIAMFGEADSVEVTNLNTYYKNENYCMPKKYFRESVNLPFEMTEILVPAYYDILLKNHKYSNFMDLVRAGGSHDYPFYKKQRKSVLEKTGVDLLQYKCTREELEKSAGRTGNAEPGQDPRSDGDAHCRESLCSRVDAFLPLFHEAHETLARFLEEGNSAVALEVLGECQNTAVQIGSMIEEEKGEGHATVTLLEQYCETVYQYYEEIAGGHAGMQRETREEMMTELAAFEKRLADSIEVDLKEKREIVFVPYKPSLWGTMDSVWQSAVEEDDTEVYVIPVPYYYKDAFGKPKKDEPHYETEGYPDYVDIISYESYNFETRHPDTIVIQCPYDEYNYGLTVHPFFYARNLKQYTDRLVYIPAFVMDEIGPGDGRAKEMLKAYCNMPGVVHADKVIVQSEQMKDVYVELLTEFAGEETKEIWEKKISASGFPVYDYEKKCKKEEMDIPEEWLGILKKPDGSWKKIVLYSTSASALLCHGEKMIEKMKEVFATFQETAGDLAVIWRPDPRAREMLRKNHPALWNRYRDLLEEYRDGAWGILDTSGDASRAVDLCDAFYGDAGTTMNACHVRKKPTMWQNIC